MYKLGDILVCVIENPYSIGDTIQIITEPRYISSLCVAFQCRYINKDYLTDTFFDDELHEYFIPLAELRENQIKSILDE